MTKTKKAESGAQKWPDEMRTGLAAKYSGYHRTWLARAASQGRLGRRFMGQYLFTRAELDEFKATERKSGPKPV